MATRTQGTLISVATAAGSAKTITGITKANPAVVSSTAHGLTAGTIVVITGVVGMTEVNDRAFVVRTVLTDSFVLGGCDSTNYTTYGSGGSATPQTMTPIAKVTGGSLFQGESPSIDATHLRSTAAEKLVGLQDFGTGNLSLLGVDSDTGQQKVRSLKRDQSVGTFAVTKVDNTIAAFQAYAKSFTQDFEPNSIWKGSIAMEYATEPSWFA